jgi:hypothetical protein
MTEHLTVRATAFARNFSRYQEEAARTGLVVVTSHDRVIGGFLSARALDHYEQLKAREGRVVTVGELSTEVIAEIEAALYDLPPG